MHERLQPRLYQFEHTVFMFYIDLEEVDALTHQTWLFGHNQSRVYDFCERDHIGDVRQYLQAQGINDSVKRIKLLTNVRTFGYIFNPVSFCFCFDANDQPICTVVEIGNTFKELKYFFLGPQARTDTAFAGKQTKYYYISPFTDLDNTLDFNIQVPDEALNIDIDVFKGDQRFFYSSMIGRRREFSTMSLLWHTLKFPFVTLKVIFLIHWHAAILHFIKKVPHHAKEENPDLQQEVHQR